MRTGTRSRTGTAALGTGARFITARAGNGRRLRFLRCARYFLLQYAVDRMQNRRLRQAGSRLRTVGNGPRTDGGKYLVDILLQCSAGAAGVLL